MVEHLPYKQAVAGSTPAGTTNLWECSSKDRALRFGRSCCGFESYHSRFFIEYKEVDSIEWLIICCLDLPTKPKQPDFLLNLLAKTEEFCKKLGF
jgi:hypothetical protein